VKAGWTHTCARKTDGAIWCWGNDNAGQLGPSVDLLPVPQPRAVGELTAAVSLTSGDSFNCAVLDGGGARCWGENADGQLGDGNSVSSMSHPVTVSGLTGALKLGAGNTHACAVFGSGSAACWGDNTHGQLGDGSRTAHAIPMPITNLVDVAEIALGFTHTCARRSDGTVWCWGENSHGELGNGPGPDQPAPTMVASLTNVAHLGAGLHHACAVKADGTVWCWGLNNQGQLGDNTTTDRAFPVQAVDLTDVVEVVAGGYETLGPVSHTCARRTSGEVRCWGSNMFGEIGDDTTTPFRQVPTAAAGVLDATSIAAGAKHSCAVRSSGGGVWCWGANDTGQIGNGSFVDLHVPTQALITCP
jgi:alpha-tubulin suppressor-like RCC1 family protein